MAVRGIATLPPVGGRSLKPPVKAIAYALESKLALFTSSREGLYSRKPGFQCPFSETHALLMLPVLLALGPILIAPRGRAYHGNQNRNRDNGEDNETDTG